MFVRFLPKGKKRWTLRLRWHILKGIAVTIREYWRPFAAGWWHTRVLGSIAPGEGGSRPRPAGSSCSEHPSSVTWAQAAPLPQASVWALRRAAPHLLSVQMPPWQPCASSKATPAWTGLALPFPALPTIQREAATRSHAFCPKHPGSRCSVPGHCCWRSCAKPRR